MRGYWVLLAALAFSSLAAAPGGDRKSSDGIPFPEVGKPYLKTSLPAVRDKMGAPPEEMGDHVFNSKTSHELLKRKLKGDLECEWFVVGFGGADIAGFDLTDGRVSRIVLARAQPSPAVAQEIATRIAKMNGGKPAQSQVVQPRNEAGDPLPVEVNSTPDRIEFRIDPIELHLQQRPTSESVKKAMRAHEPAEGMTIDEAKLLFGTPSSDDKSDAQENVTWEFKAPIPYRPTSAKDGYQHLMEKPSMRTVRVVRMTFEQDVAVSVSDRKRE